jgi:hypothetical protein
MTTSSARRDASRLADLLRTEQVAMADFLLALADFDRHRSWAALGHASLWAFLHHDLGLSAGAAFQRKEAAALLRRIPEVLAPLRDGRLCLSSVAELAKVLTPANQAEVLPRFFRKSAREARELAAELGPKTLVPTRVMVTKVLPSASALIGPALLTSETEMTQPDRAAAVVVAPVNSDRLSPDVASPGLPHREPVGAPVGASTTSAVTLAPVPRPPSSIEPLTADLRRLHLTVSRAFLQKLDAVRLARSHASPGATIEALLEEAMDTLLAREAKRRTAATGRPLSVARPAAADAIPAHVRREVWARDEGRCQWPLESGGVCGATWQLEVDHRWPKGRGGPPTADNLRLLCHAHNAEAARRLYGEPWMERSKRRGGGGAGREGQGPAGGLSGASEHLPGRAGLGYPPPPPWDPPA